MVQYYYRETGNRASVINGPFPTIEAARLSAITAGLKVRDLGFLMKDGPHMVKIDSTGGQAAPARTSA